MKTKYYVENDLQGGDWAMGVTQSAEQWRRTALGWAYSDENNWAIKHLKALYRKADAMILEFISDYWQIEFAEEKKGA